jgi:hypothetical protein
MYLLNFIYHLELFAYFLKELVSHYIRTYIPTYVHLYANRYVRRDENIPDRVLKVFPNRKNHSK